MKMKFGYKQIADILKELKGQTIDLSIRVKIDFEDIANSQIIIQQKPRRAKKREDKILDILKEYKELSPHEISQIMKEKNMASSSRSIRNYLIKLEKDGCVKANRKSKSDPTVKYIISGRDK